MAQLQLKMVQMEEEQWNQKNEDPFDLVVSLCKVPCCRQDHFLQLKNEDPFDLVVSLCKVTCCRQDHFLQLLYCQMAQTGVGQYHQILRLQLKMVQMEEEQWNQKNEDPFDLVVSLCKVPCCRQDHFLQLKNE